jgi:hypothetical protein
LLLLLLPALPLLMQGLLHSEAAAQDDAAQQEEELKQREQEAMDREVAALHQQQHEFGALHQAAATVDLTASVDDEVPVAAAAADGRQQQQHEQQQQQHRPAVSPRLLALQQQQGGSGSGSGSSSSMRRSGSYQGLSSLPGRQQGSSSQLAQLAAAQLHLQQQSGNSPRSADLLGVSPTSQLQQLQAMHTAAGASSGSNTPPLVGQITRQQSAQLAAAVASSYGRVDASRAASVASLPSLSAGMGVGGGPGSRMAGAVKRVDSDISQVRTAGCAQ